MSLDDAFDQVAAFHRAFGHPVKDRPAFLPSPRSDARVAWMREEVDEFVESANVADQALATLVERGVRPAPLCASVHTATVQKLCPDGAARIREDGKTIKPPTWRDPAEALKAEIARQLDERG